MDQTKIKIRSPAPHVAYLAVRASSPTADCPPGSRRTNYLSDASAPRHRERQGLDLIGGSRPGLVCRALNFTRNMGPLTRSHRRSGPSPGGELLQAEGFRQEINIAIAIQPLSE